MDIWEGTMNIVEGTMDIVEGTMEGVMMSMVVLQTILTWGRKQGRRLEAESVSCS